jgi:hypothetical protein
MTTYRRDIVARLAEESDFIAFNDPYLGTGVRLMTEEERRQDAISEIKWLRACNEDLEILLRGRTAELRAEIERLRIDSFFWKNQNSIFCQSCGEARHER